MSTSTLPRPSTTAADSTPSRHAGKVVRMRRSLPIAFLALTGCSGAIGGESRDAALTAPDAAVVVNPDAAVVNPDAAATPNDAAAPPNDAAAPPNDAAAPPNDDAATANDDAATACPSPDAGAPFAGAIHMLAPGATLRAALAAAGPGDRVIVAGGSYPSEALTQTFAADVLIEAKSGEIPIFHGLSLTNVGHLVFRGIHFDGTVNFQGAHDITFDGVDLDVGAQDISGLELFNSRGATHDIRVINSRIAGGARTIFMGGRFGLEETWNHHLEFRNNEFICGTHNCFQLSGARDVLIEDNHFHDPRGAGVLTAGAARVVISRNRMIGGGVMSPAIQLATPGVEWDNYGGVEHMTSSDITVANNLITGWAGGGIELHAMVGAKIVYNTIVGAGLHTWRRSPHDQQGNVILVGNEDVRLWNNIMTSVSLDMGDPRPVFESNNLVERGGGGTALITGAAQFADMIDFAPMGMAIDRAVVDADTPLLDRRGRVRGAMPDLGAFEAGAPAPACP